MKHPIMTPDQLAARFGCSREQIIAQYKKVATDMRADLNAAITKGATVIRKLPIEKFRALTEWHEELAQQ